MGFITPNTYFDLKRSGTKLRKFLFSNNLMKIVEVYNVFPDAVVEPVISIYQKAYSPDTELEIILIPRKTALTSTFIADGICSYKTQADLKENEDYIFNYKINDNKKKIIELIKKESKPLAEFYYVYNGAKPYEAGKGTPPQTKEMIKSRVYNGYTKVDDSWLPYMRGKRIHRYTNMWDGEYIKYGENLAAPRLADIFFREKIFVRQTGDTIIATLDENNVGNNTLHIIYSKGEVSNKYLLGILNSKFMSWVYQQEHPLEVGKPMAEVKKAFVEDLPIKIGSFEQVNTIESLVESLLLLCQDRYKKKKTFLHYIERTYVPQKISETMESFDILAYKDFCEELKKQKAKITAMQKMELLSLYEETQSYITKDTMRIEGLQAQLDREIFSLYGISEKIIELISSEITIKL